MLSLQKYLTRYLFSQFCLRKTINVILYIYIYMCGCVCVCVRVRACVCVCVNERNRVTNTIRTHLFIF